MPKVFSIELFANDVLEYLNSKQIDQIDIFGYSMGGYVALYLAKHNLHRIGRIFTLATKLEWTEEIALKETKMLNPEKIQEKIPQFADIIIKRHNPQDWRLVLYKTAEMMIEMEKNNPLKLEDFTNINHFVRISIGDNDNMVSLNKTLDVFNRLTNSSLLVIPHTQHSIEKVDNDRLIYEIKNWFV